MKLTKSMTEFGTFTFTFTPPEMDYYDAFEPTITLSLSGEANREDLVRAFASFLLVNGYQLPEEKPSTTEGNSTPAQKEDWEGFWNSTPNYNPE